ncbi:MAG: sialidase family protein, partial [Candidatus Latescibacteria bacterium]|nr:sialidase family protein [Candidatus Latescibacterota bacterium]
TRSDGVILVPVQTTPIGDDGEYFNPGSGYTYTDCMLLMGTWRSDGSISWTTSQRIVGDPSLTTRGLIEPTIAELDDGSIVMVMRGSNDRQTELPAHKWVSRSTDGGSTWTKAVPWTYTDGEKFHSPSACSQLVPYSDGRLFWVGNICDENARGNSPRYPIVIGQVDLGTGLLRKRSVTVLDDRQDSESEHLTLSNFFVREDRESLQLLLHMTRLFANDQREAGVIDWTSDAMVYRIALS